MEAGSVGVKIKIIAGNPMKAEYVHSNNDQDAASARQSSAGRGAGYTRYVTSDNLYAALK